MLRSATTSDLKIVASWIPTARDCELWAGWRVPFPIDLDTLPEAISFMDTNSFSLIIEDGRFVAFGQLVEKNSSRGHLARLIVAPALRRRGYGEALVQALVQRARAASFTPVSLNVDIANLPAIALYSKLGFRDAARPADESESPDSRYMENAA